MKKNKLNEDIENVGGGISLRKLTLRSKWDFTPKHQGWTIEEVLKHNPKSLFWAYTHLEKISFTDDILDILAEKFPSFHRIPKPGIDHEQYNNQQTKDNPWKDKTPDELLTIIRAKKLSGNPIPPSLRSAYNIARSKKIGALSDRNVASKSELQRTNHGKLDEQKMKKYIFTETQIKTIINSQINEQQSGWDATYNNPPISQQMKKYPAGTKFGFSPKMAEFISKNFKSNILYQVKPGDTISGIVQKLGANSIENVLGDNDLLHNNVKAIQPGMVITLSLLPSGN